MDAKDRGPTKEGSKQRDPMDLLGEAMQEPVLEEMNSRLRATLAEFREELEDHPYVRKLDRARLRKRRFAPRQSFLRRLALSGAGAFLIVMVYFLLPFGNGTPTWAEVSQRFQTVTFFKMTVYEKKDLLSEADRFEYWRGRDGRSRLHTDGQVIFGKGSMVMRAFDVRERTEISPKDLKAASIILRFGREDQFSLDTFFDLGSGGSYELSETTATVNPYPTISHDLVVFDITDRGSTTWYRVWALKESKLPVRVLVVDPRSERSADVFFTYAKDQPGEFFDPEVFARKLADPSVVTEELVFGDQRDPLGKPITRSQMKRTEKKEIQPDETTKIGLPVVQRAGVDADGVVWVIAETGNTIGPDGRPLSLCWGIEDPTKQEYHQAQLFMRRQNDSTEVWNMVFIPDGYPFDAGRPESVVVTLRQVVGKPASERTVPVGKVAVENLERDVSAPWGGGNESLLISQARWLDGKGRTDKAERVLDLIPGEPEESETALRRDQIRLSILVKRGTDWEEAVRLGARLQPILEQQYAAFDRKYRLRGTKVWSFEDYVKALLKTDRMDEAAAVVQRILNTPLPEIPDDLGLSSRQRRELRERMIRHDAEELETFAYNIFLMGGLTIEEMNLVFGTNVLEDERFRELSGSFLHGEKQRKEREEQTGQIQALMEYFESNPWPDDAVLIPAKTVKPGMNYRDGPVPDKPGYRYAAIIGEPYKTVGDYFRYGGSYGPGRIRVADEFREIELEHCLVYRKGAPKRVRDNTVLDYFGLEVVVVTEPRTVWIARHDGRTLKPYTEVKAPYPYDDERIDKTGTARDPAPVRYTLERLFNAFMRDRDPSLSADGVLIIDETGIESEGDGSEEGKPVFVSSDSPYWTGEGGPEMAREWFKNELGVTFREEVRPETVYVVRRKGPREGE
jgi:hypothetical protein